MKSAYRSVMFYIGQKELEMQYKMNRIVGHCRQKCELMQAKFTEKLEEVHTAYQKMVKRCKLLEQENENLNRDKHELQEKFAEKSRLAMCQYLLILQRNTFCSILYIRGFRDSFPFPGRRGSLMRCMTN
jgi:hypothetical protein